MIWATVSSWSCFCWLYRVSPSSAAKNIISLILVLTIWWGPCVETSLVLLEEVLFYDQCAHLYLYVWRKNGDGSHLQARVLIAVWGSKQMAWQRRVRRTIGMWVNGFSQGFPEFFTYWKQFICIFLFLAYINLRLESISSLIWRESYTCKGGMYKL